MVPILNDEQINLLINFDEIEFEGCLVYTSEHDMHNNSVTVDDLGDLIVPKSDWNARHIAVTLGEILSMEFPKYCNHAELDPEHAEHMRIIEHVSCLDEGLTGSEVMEIMNGY